MALADSAVDDGWPPLDLVVGLRDPDARRTRPASHLRSIAVLSAEADVLGELVVAWLETRRW